MSSKLLVKLVSVANAKIFLKSKESYLSPYSNQNSTDKQTKYCSSLKLVQGSSLWWRRTKLQSILLALIAQIVS